MGILYCSIKITTIRYSFFIPSLVGNDVVDILFSTISNIYSLQQLDITLNKVRERFRFKEELPDIPRLINLSATLRPLHDLWHKLI